MNFFPVFAREFKSDVERDRLRKERFVAALITGLILVVLIVAERSVGGFNLRRFVSMIPIGGIIPFMLVVIGLSRAGNLLAVERREGTLPLLLLTRLTGLDIMLGKMLQALATEVFVFLGMLPALVLPFIALGFQFGELSMTVIGCLNVMFFSLALGLLASVFGDGPKATSWCLLLLLPLLAFSTPFGFLLPAGGIRECLAALQWLNPCDALAHVPTATAGFHPGAYWWALVSSHVVGWCLLGLAGLLLPRAYRWEAGFNAGSAQTKTKWWRAWTTGAINRSAIFRSNLLNRNPVLWLTSRERWPTAQIWLWLTIAAAGCGWLAWVGRGVGVPIYFVLVVALAAVWHITLLVLVPGDASRHLVEDRLSGALEMILCTPLGVKEIIRGQWCSLGRRYLPPIIAVMLLEAVLMITGSATDGFGGMLEPEDRGLWFVFWLAGILVLPLWVTALCWVALRRALFARNFGEASGGAVVQVLFVPGFTLWIIYALARWAGWNPDAWVAAALFIAALIALLVTFAYRARRILYADLREAAASRYFGVSSKKSRGWLLMPSHWPIRRQRLSAL